VGRKSAAVWLARFRSASSFTIWAASVSSWEGFQLQDEGGGKYLDVYEGF